jgi:hypothetical protein
VRRDWLLWAALRAALVVIILGWVPWPEQVNDLRIYADWVAASLGAGEYPQDTMWQYPPLAGLVFLLGAWLPGGRMGFVLLFLAVDAAIMGMLATQSGRTGRTGGRRLWALLPLLTGPLLLARFDVVPTALAVAAVIVARARPALSGAFAAVGAWIKVWPALVVSGLRRADLPRGLLAALATSAAIVVVLLLTTRDPMGFLTGQRDRGLQIESVAAWPFLVGRALGLDVAVVYQYGAHEVLAPGVEVAAGVTVLVTAALIGLVAVQRLRGALEHLPAADGALATVLFSVVTSRVFSGQYFIWLLGLAAVCLGDPATRMRRTTALLIGAAAATHLVYPWLYTALLEGRLVALLVQTARIGLTVAATVLAIGVLLGRPAQEAAGSPGVGSSGSGSPGAGSPGT